MNRDRRQRIMHAAAALLENKAHHDEVTVAAIAERAAVSKATLYRHFPTKADLLSALERGGHRVPPPGPGRREQILEAALGVLGKAGFKGFTMDAIARATGLTPAALYWHFSSKEELLKALARRYSVLSLAEQLTEAPGSTTRPEASLRAFAGRLAEVVLERADLLWLIISEAQAEPELAREVIGSGLGPVLAALAAYLEAGAARGHFRPGNSLVRAQALLSLFVMLGLARRAFGELLPFSAEEASREYLDIFLRGIASAPRPASEGGREP